MKTLTDHGRKVLGKLCQLLPPADFQKITSLRELQKSLPRVRVPTSPKEIPGWMTFNEQRALYALARFSPSPMLEIGAWLGRSTVCIGQGIVDSGRKKEFLTCELAPTMANFRLVAENTIGFFYPVESETSMGTVPIGMFENDIQPFVSNPIGIIGQLKANLAASGVLDATSIFHGDFRKSIVKRYNFVFTDAMHDAAEITRNAADLYQFLGPGSILACHDTTPENEKLLRKYFQFGHSLQVDSLFIGEIQSFKNLVADGGET